MDTRPGLVAAAPLTNVETLELDRLPDHLIVLGGGYIELAQAYRRFGSRVSIVEVEPELAGREDPDVADAVLEMLHDNGIEVHLGGTGVSCTIAAILSIEKGAPGERAFNEAFATWELSHPTATTAQQAPATPNGGGYPSQVERAFNEALRYAPVGQ
ncbi:FAD-dependent oxidoreductase [Bradyrhizobium sp. JYMT SZCCT0428]|uniref:FAD-dependent oxidoreductase n=1 Tax=Bradyrhizobium sp. JYMT SZCCT0428 TaxID=2807673 RepID=UPI002010DAE1|nr:FAD-dependent oxidoreductase [Bradyrhizobium sp. JYMT SZCCT0428]